jgi:uncharacterized membrane protein YfcA
MTTSARQSYYYCAPLTLFLLLATSAFNIRAHDGDDAATSWQSTSTRRRTTTTTTTTNDNDNHVMAMTTLLSADTNMYIVSHFIHRIDINYRRLSFLDEDEDLLPEHVFPLRYPYDYIGFGCAILGLLLAAGGGIGGGGMLVPIYILLLQFPVKHAIPLASITVFGGAIANNVLNVKKCHPLFPQRPAIDWDLMVLLVPTMIAGAVVGAVLNKIFPDILLAVLMLVLLSITAKETFAKAMKMYREEERVLLLQGGGEKSHDDDDDEKRRWKQENGNYCEENNESSPRATEQTPLVVSSSNEMHLETDFNTTQYDSETKNGVDNNGIIKNHDEKSLKRKCIEDAIKLTTLFAFVAIVDVMQKSGLVQSCGAYCHWGSELLLFLAIAIFTYFARSEILARRKACGPIVSEIGWDESNTTIYPIFAIVAGLVAGMFGIGGGIIVGPLMLAIGVHPQVASATSACMVLFTSATSTLSFLIFGYLKGDYAIFCLGLGFLSTLVGQTVMTVLLTWSGGRNSYIAFCVGGVVGISAVAMGIESAVAISKS